MKGSNASQVTSPFLLLAQGGADEPAEEGMGVRWSGLEFRVELAAQKPRMVLEFDDFRQTTVGRNAGDLKFLSARALLKSLLNS